VTNLITDFVDGLSNWYVRRSRDRFWSGEKTADKADAHWTLYEALLTTAKLIAPFTPFLAEALWRRDGVQTLCALLVLGVGFGVARVWMSLAEVPHTPVELLSPHAWPDAWVRLARNGLRSVGHAPAILALAALAGVLVGVRRDARTVLGAGALTATAITSALVVGTFSWVGMNESHFRYLIPSLLALQTALAVLAALPLQGIPGQGVRRR